MASSVPVDDATSPDDVNVDVVVVGAGVCGLAIARAALLARERDTSVLVIESKSDFGLSTSSRNSEVVHAGIYYPPDSLKAQLCVRGNRLLWEYLQQAGVPHRKCGKLLVACSPSELRVLDAIYERATRNGVELVRVSKEEVAAVYGEPHVRCVAALWSPSSGVMDSRAYMARLERDVRELGGEIRYNSVVIGGTGPAITVRGPSTRNPNATSTLYTVRARHVVNAAGLYARAVSLTLGVDPSDVPKIVYVKGNYFAPTSPSGFSQLSKNQLVYPIPVEGGLGIHATVDVNGGLRFGPDVEFLADLVIDSVEDDIDHVYPVDASREASFHAAIGTYVPVDTTKRQREDDEDDDDDDRVLRPAYAGIRPKAVDHNNKAINDFVISTHTNPSSTTSLVALYGIESPGLTASLAIAETVLNHLSVVEAVEKTSSPPPMRTP